MKVGNSTGAAAAKGLLVASAGGALGASDGAASAEGAESVPVGNLKPAESEPLPDVDRNAL